MEDDDPDDADSETRPLLSFIAVALACASWFGVGMTFGWLALKILHDPRFRF